jgi:hypothetical protein
MEEEDGEGQNKQILERDGAALHLCLTITVAANWLAMPSCQYDFLFPPG